MLIGGVGCEKEKLETDLMRQKIVGTWEWIYTYQYPGFNWRLTPIQGEKLELTFTDNRVLATHNMEISDGESVITENKNMVLDGSFVITKEKDVFYITITPKEVIEEYRPLVETNQLNFNQENDTLFISSSRERVQVSNVYKRVNE